MAKLGSEKRPAVVRVQDQNRAGEMINICNAHGWTCIAGIEPDKSEDISDVEKLLHPPEPVLTQVKTGRNESCHCGSGRKFKKCCLT